ncbi:MAG: hypothetical protein IJZ20_03570, partial [Clostridia bacterium]|nr:hypothetical protein [Clostridia bacterium]
FLVCLLDRGHMIPETVTKFWFNFASQNYTSPCYIDDVSITPHYKITYDIGGGEGETPADEYFLADSYTLKADTSTFSAPGGVAEFSHWEDQFGREIVTTVTPVLGEDLVLTAVYVSDYEKNKPGINLWTGTTEAYDFEGDLTLTDNATGDINKDWAAAEDVFIADDNGNKVMHLKGNRTRFSVNADFSIDADRPVTLSYRFKTAATTEMWMTVRTNKSGYWKTSPSTFFVWESGAYKVDLSKGETNEWTPQTSTFLPKNGINSTYDEAPTSAERFWFQLATAYSTPVYIDDVSFIPNYKVTYDLGEGSGETPADEYFLADEYTLGADLSKITAPSGKIFAYWQDQNGNKFYNNIVVPTPGEDLVLTAVYEDTSNYAPQTEPGSEMRLSSNTATNGIRFKASIAPSKKAESDEIGFIVARKDILDYLGADLTFDLTADGVENAEGTLFAKGVAYDKATGKDIVYGTTDDGAEIFTAVCVGINIENEAQVRSVLVARPYAKLTVNGNAVTVYGTANSASLAQVAVDLKTAADNGDADALAAYEGAQTYIDTVIATGSN